jgi:hypothetical protein
LLGIIPFTMADPLERSEPPPTRPPINV